MGSGVRAAAVIQLSSRSHSTQHAANPNQPNHMHASQLHPNGARAWFPPKGKVVATPLGVVRVEWSGFSEPAELILAIYHSPLWYTRKSRGASQTRKVIPAARGWCSLCGTLAKPMKLKSVEMGASRAP